jgi:hypothetical protein
MSVTLTVSEIGRADHPDATERSEHVDVDSARSALVARFGADHIRGAVTYGTVGSRNGRVFQASRVWSIR